MLISVQPLIALEDWGVSIMPLSEIKPGMRGTGKTVFYGDKIEDFGVEVLEIIENFYPKRNVILVRLTGDKAEQAGVVSGMSGSPVYINNRLAGALALRFGEFMKEPIGGVMPIEDMLEVASKEAVRNIELIKRTSLLPQYLQGYLCGTEEAFWGKLLAEFSPSSENSGTSLTTIQSPLVFSGFGSLPLSSYQDLFRSLGFISVQSGSKSAEPPANMQKFEPGSAVSQVFISGDIGIDATGTVTAVHNNKLLAFGHSVFNLGPVNLPVAGAKILATLPSLMGSNKMAVSTEIVGSVRQDRLCGVFADLSIQPQMVPVHLKLLSPADGEHEYNFRMAVDPALNNLMPFFMRIGLIQAMIAARLSSGESSMHLQTRIELSNHRVLELTDFFSSQQILGMFSVGGDAIDASDWIAATMGILLVNDFDAPTISKVDLLAKIEPGERIAKINSVWQDQTEVNPGDSLMLIINLRNTAGNEQKLLRRLRIPKRIEAQNLSIFIASGDALTRYEIQANPEKYIPVSYEHLLSILENKRKNNYLYLQVRIRDDGILFEGKELGSLPPSIMNVMDSDRAFGESKRLRDRILMEQVIPMDYAISGAKRLNLRIIQPQKASLPKMEEDDSAQPVYW